MSETWKDIEGYNGRYRVSNLGRVMSMWQANQYKNHIGKPMLLKPATHRQGYLYVHLTNNGETKKHYVHRLVAEAFIPNPDNLPQINHKDENKSNNIVDNLEWCDGKYNSNYGTRVERHRAMISKPVIQTTMDGEYVRWFQSATVAENECGYDSAYISQVCNGKRPNAYGYKFHFANISTLIEALDDLYNPEISDEELEGR